jgi:hypothetical protein
MGGFPVRAPLLSWHILLATTPTTSKPLTASLSSCHLSSTHPRGISHSLSPPFIFRHLFLSLPHHPHSDVLSLDQSHPTIFPPFAYHLLAPCHVSHPLSPPQSLFPLTSCHLITGLCWCSTHATSIHPASPLLTSTPRMPNHPCLVTVHSPLPI